MLRRLLGADKMGHTKAWQAGRLFPYIGCDGSGMSGLDTGTGLSPLE